MGTFILAFNSVVSQVGSPWKEIAGGLTSDSALLAAINRIVTPAGFGINSADIPTPTGLNSVNAEFSAKPFGNSWYLDGSVTPIDFASLPSGFTVISAIFESTIKLNYSGAGGEVTSATGTRSLNGNVVDTVDVSNLGDHFLDFDIITNDPSTSALDLSTITALVSIAASINSGNPANVASMQVSNNSNPYWIFGTYSILFNTYTINSPVHIGDRVTLHSDDGGIGIILINDGEDRSGINLIFSGGTHNIKTVNIVELTDTDLTFILDVDFSVEETVTVSATLKTGGVILIKSLQVLLYGNVSGVYTLVSGKTTDTIYRHDGTTTEVAIPEPFAKIGFIGN